MYVIICCNLCNFIYCEEFCGFIWERCYRISLLLRHVVEKEVYKNHWERNAAWLFVHIKPDFLQQNSFSELKLSCCKATLDLSVHQAGRTPQHPEAFRANFSLFPSVFSWLLWILTQLFLCPRTWFNSLCLWTASISSARNTVKFTSVPECTGLNASSAAVAERITMIYWRENPTFSGIMPDEKWCVRFMSTVLQEHDETSRKGPQIKTWISHIQQHTLLFTGVCQRPLPSLASSSHLHPIWLDVMKLSTTLVWFKSRASRSESALSALLPLFSDGKRQEMIICVFQKLFPAPKFSCGAEGWREEMTKEMVRIQRKLKSLIFWSFDPCSPSLLQLLFHLSTSPSPTICQWMNVSLNMFTFFFSPPLMTCFAFQSKINCSMSTCCYSDYRYFLRPEMDNKLNISLLVIFSLIQHFKTKIATRQHSFCVNDSATSHVNGYHAKNLI